jgi:predicted DNA-binding protein
MVKKTAKKQSAKRGRPPQAVNGLDAAVSIKLPKELRDAATAKSKRTGVAMSFVVRKCLEQWVASDE